MNAVIILLAAFVVIGLTFTSFNRKTRLLVFFIAACMVAYITIK